MKPSIALLCLLFLGLPTLALSQAQENNAGNATQDAVSGEQELLEAWRREYAFLSAQKRNLEQRLQRFRTEAEDETGVTRSRIETLQEDVIALEAETQRTQNRIREMEQVREAAERNADVLRATFQQASVTFEEQGVGVMKAEGFEERPEEDRLNSVFDAGTTLLERLSSLHREPGTFYTQSGDKAEGEILRFGGVATYGVADDTAGILVPAGGGEMKLWRDPNAGTARALAEGETPPVLPMYIHGAGNSAVQTSKGGGVLDTINSGGTIAWLIMLLASLATGLIIARIVFLQRASASTGEIADEVGELVEQGDTHAAIELCRKRKGSTAAVVASALRNLGREREALDDIINESILHESTHLERFGTMILVIAAVSPLLGLLGTVTGMITTFEVITDHGTGDPQLLSGGISVALVTTELGLIVAIPALLIGNMLSGWADRIKDDMHKAALRVINRHEKRTQEQRRAAA